MFVILNLGHYDLFDICILGFEYLASKTLNYPSFRSPEYLLPLVHRIYTHEWIILLFPTDGGFRSVSRMDPDLIA